MMWTFYSDITFPIAMPSVSGYHVREFKKFFYYFSAGVTLQHG